MAVAASAAPLSNAHDATLAAKLPQPLQHLATTPATITYGQKGATISLLCRADSPYAVEIWERSNHTANLIEYVLCATHLEEVALIVGLVQRKSRFDVQCYVTAWLSISFDNVTNDCKRFEGLYTAYLNALQEKYGEDAHLHVITKTAFYLHIIKPEAALFAEVISSQVMTANNLQYPASALGGVKAYFEQTLNETLGNGDPIHLGISDGSTITVVPRAANDMDCQTSGRKKQTRENTGGASEPQAEVRAMKLHSLIDPVSGQEYCHYLGSGVSSELAVVKNFASPHLISVHDRAADSKEHRHAMLEANGNYLLRMKNNHVYEVLQATDGLTGEDLTKTLQGKKLKEIPEMEQTFPLLDLNVAVPFAGSEQIVIERVIMCLGLDANGKHQYQVLTTNLPPDLVPAVVAPEFYGLRWSIENEQFRNAKSTCALSSINSGKDPLVKQSLCFALITLGCRRNICAATQSQLYAAGSTDPAVQAFKADPEAAIRKIAAAVEDPDITSVQLPPNISLEKVCRSLDQGIKKYFLAIVAGRGRTYLWKCRSKLIKRWLKSKCMHSDTCIKGRKLKRRKLFQVKMCVIIANLLDARQQGLIRPSS